jgi:hypothetical protein
MFGQTTPPSTAFLVGAQRSGTTALAAGLGRHPDLAMLVNGKVAYLLIVWLLNQRTHIEALHARLDEVAHAFMRRRPVNLSEANCTRIATYLSGDAARHVSSLRNHDNTCSAIRAICQDVADLLNPGHRCHIEKYNEYLLQLPELDLVFPRARYIFIHREPHDVAESMVRHFTGRPWAPADHLTALEKWARWNELWLEHRRRIPSARRHEVCYEELVHKPDHVVRGILLFLGVEAGDDRVRDACSDIRAGTPRRDALAARALYDAGSLSAQEYASTLMRVRAVRSALSPRDPDPS